MQIVILAAGSGRRMKSLTKNQHKSLLDIGNGETFFSRICHQINEYDISKTVVVTGYRSQDIVNELSKFQFNFEVVHNDRYEEDVNIYSVKLALDSLSASENTIIIEADVIMDSLSFRDIYFASSMDKSIWFTRGQFKNPQYGGILKQDEFGSVCDIRIVEEYDKQYSRYSKLLGITTIGKNEIKSFSNLVNDYCKNSINQYYLMPWIENLKALPCESEDLNSKSVTSINTPAEYSNYIKSLDISKQKGLDFEIIALDKLVPIEGYIEDRKKMLFNKIKEECIWTKPLIVDCDNYMIMDGHHRFEVAKELKLTKIPVILVSYDDIEIWSLRNSEEVSPRLVKERALASDLYPNKTVKHHFPFTISDCYISLKELI